MIRYRFHLRFIHRLRAVARVGSACRNHPVFGCGSARAASASFNAAGIDSQLRFAAGEEDQIRTELAPDYDRIAAAFHTAANTLR